MDPPGENPYKDMGSNLPAVFVKVKKRNTQGHGVWGVFHVFKKCLILLLSIISLPFTSLESGMSMFKTF